MRFMLFIIALVAALAGCGSWSEPVPEPVDFTLTILPSEGVGSIPAQPALLMIEVQNIAATSATAGPVSITAECPNAEVTVLNASAVGGAMAELLITPDGNPLDDWTPAGMYTPESCRLPVSVTGTREDLTHTVSVDLTLYHLDAWDGTADPAATTIRDILAGWLADEHPELGITGSTQWEALPSLPYIGGPPTPGWTTYDFLSDEWDMHLFWIGEYASISLRERFSESEASLSWEFDDYNADPLVPNS